MGQQLARQLARIPERERYYTVPASLRLISGTGAQQRAMWPAEETPLKSCHEKMCSRDERMCSHDLTLAFECALAGRRLNVQQPSGFRRAGRS